MPALIRASEQGGVLPWIQQGSRDTYIVAPATGAVAAMISKATGREPYYVGKPNPLMIRTALNRLDAHSESTAMVGAPASALMS